MPFDIHKEWLPKAFIKSIPEATSQALKYNSTEKYVGQQCINAINNNVEELEVVLIYDID